MHKPVTRAQGIDECAEINGLDHLAGVNAVELRFATISMRCRLLHPMRYRCCDLDGAVILDIDLGAGCLTDFADHLRRADDISDLVDIDLQW